MKIKDVVYGLGIRFCCHTITLYRNDNGRMIYYGMVCDIPKYLYSKPVNKIRKWGSCVCVAIE